MKFIKVPENIALQATDGSRFVDLGGKPVIKTYRQFLLEKLADATFVRGRTGMAATLFTIDARDAIVRCPEAGEWLEVSEEVHAALKATIESPTTPDDQRFAWCLISFMQATINAVEAVPAMPATESK